MIVAGNHKCRKCLKGKTGCKFTAAEEEDEEDKGENDDIEEELQKSWLPVAALKKILSSLFVHCTRERRLICHWDPSRRGLKLLLLPIVLGWSWRYWHLRWTIMTQCHLCQLFHRRFLVVLLHLLIFSTLPKTLPFATSNWLYMCCKRILPVFKSSLC